MIAQLSQEYAHPEVDAPAGTGEPIPLSLSGRQQISGVMGPDQQRSVEYFINSGLADTLTALLGRVPEGGVGWQPGGTYAGEYLPISQEVTLAPIPEVPHQLDPSRPETFWGYTPVLEGYAARGAGEYRGEANQPIIGEMMGSLYHPELVGEAQTVVPEINKPWQEVQPEDLQAYQDARVDMMKKNRARFPHLFQPGHAEMGGFGTMVHEFGHVGELQEGFTRRTINGVMRQFQRYVERYPYSYPGNKYETYQRLQRDNEAGVEWVTQEVVDRAYTHAKSEYFAETFERGVGVLRQTRHLKKKEAQAVINREQEAWPGLSVMVRSLLKAPIFAMHPLVRSDQTSSGQSR